VPIDSGPLKGIDALLSTSMMPAGVPVATMGIGKAGASNAAVLAAQILARSDPEMAQRLKEYKKKLADKVEERDRELKKTQNA
jgi:phosphoribosylaminoimidazole carboxylase PurE protein